MYIKGYFMYYFNAACTISFKSTTVQNAWVDNFPAIRLRWTMELWLNKWLQWLPSGNQT